MQQKREGHAVGRAGSYSTEPGKVDKYKFTGRQTSPKFCCLQVKGDTYFVLWHIFLLGLLLLQCPPSCFCDIHTHTLLSLSASCPMIQFFITHQHPLDQCSGARLLVITAMTQTPLALKPEKHNLVTSYSACRARRTACCYNTASQAVRVLFIPWTRPATFRVLYNITVLLAFIKMPVETDIHEHNSKKAGSLLEADFSRQKAITNY